MEAKDRIDLKINAMKKANVKPILIVRIPLEATDDIRFLYKKKFIKDTDNQYHVIIIGTDIVKEITFEVVK
jgi:hypothetical protein